MATKDIHCSFLIIVMKQTMKVRQYLDLEEFRQLLVDISVDVPDTEREYKVSTIYCLQSCHDLNK